MEITLNEKKLTGRKKAHAYLKKKLDFPDYYGENLDALYDCLGEIMEETTIVVPGGIGDKDHLGEYGQRMLQVFRDAAEENPVLKVVIR